MSFSPVSPQVSFPELDNQWLNYWEDRNIFEKTYKGREDAAPFVFYEGPPTANGMPHAGHVLTRVMKDVYLRYKSMCGYYVPRIAGWDTHGLPVEVEVEKTLGIHGKEAIAEYGVEAFSQRCVESVFKYIEEWRRMTRRIGFWVDLDKAYVTFHKSYVESVWWALKTLFEKGLLYKGHKVVWWWPQGGTALSSGEVGDGYKEVDDPSVMVRFPVKGEEKTSFLAWTTTPWTLPSNIGLAVHENVDYQTIEITEDGTSERIIVAKALAEKALKGREAFTVVSECKGSALVGKEYEPPFRYAEPEGGPAYRVISADFVTTDSGSGLVHLAPAFGEDDNRVCKDAGLGFLQLVKPDGTFPPEVTDFAGRFCKEADRDIIRNMKQRGILFHEEVYRHDYPFCWRAMEDPLIQYARESWFIRTTQEIDKVIENNQHVTWRPEHIKDGRFGQYLASNVDWALSRERFWGTPLPVWINDETGQMDAVGSVAEILERNPKAFEKFEAAKKENPELSDHLCVHKPWIDDVTWEKSGEPGVYRRVTEVIDCWFDSGCMPFAQFGYPHMNQEEFKRDYPADFITEAIDQTRGWFYSLMTIGTLLFGEDSPIGDQGYPRPFKNCNVLGFITDAEGKKMSKKLKNYTDPMELMESAGADAVRWALYSGSVPGLNTKFRPTAGTEALRDFLLKLWNVYSFFVTYANIDGWTPDKCSEAPALAERPDLDRWILAELDATIRSVRASLDDFNSNLAARQLGDFNESLSNWYVRRSRARFWAEGNSADKASAFATLYEVLVDYAKVLAPFTPFLSEAIYQNLAGEGAEESVHLAAFPEPNDARKDEQLRADVDLARTTVTLGQRVRAEQKLKVRQPLSEAICVVANDDEVKSIERFHAAICEELNVHTLAFTKEPTKYVDFELVPNFRALGPKLGKEMPACKKALAQADGSALFEEMESKGHITVALPSGEVQLTSEEVQVRLKAKEGFAAAATHGHVVVLDTHVTEALKLEGLAREVVNRVQRARKAMDLAYDARIKVTYETEGEVAAAIEAHGERIAGETLATALVFGTGTGEAQDGPVDGTPLRFWVETV